MTTNEFIRKLDELFAAQEYEKVEPFMLSVLEEAKERDDYGLYLSVGNEMIGYYRSISQFRKAYQISEDMLLLMEELQMDQSAEFATVLLNTATAYSFDENFEMALQFYRRAEQIYHLLVSPEDYLFAGLYNNMSSLMEKMGKNEEALTLLMKALGILRNYPDRQMEAATNFTNLGLLYLKTGDHESGKKCVMQAIGMFEALDTPASHYSAALSALGEIYYHEKDYEQAALWYEKTLAEIKKHYGFNLAYAVVCENLAKVCREAGKEDEEKEWLTRAGEVRKRLESENNRESHTTDKINTASAAGSREEAGAPKTEGMEQSGGENAENAGEMEMAAGAEKKGMARCREYYERYGKPMLAQFPELRGHYAAGLVGEGSECFGYDDMISTDHDYFPRFFIWLDDEAYEKYGEALQAAYRKLPKRWSDCSLSGSVDREQSADNSSDTFLDSDTEKEQSAFEASNSSAKIDTGRKQSTARSEAVETIVTPAGAKRCGVCRTTDFYFMLLGRKTPPEAMYDWISLQETRLATVTNGEVFEDCGGGFTAQREVYLSGFPEDVRRKKLAARLRKMAQMGQYQYARCMMRGEHVAAQMALAEFIQYTGSCCFLLAGQYMPYFKWMQRRMKELPVLSEVAGKLEKLSVLPCQQDRWDTKKPEQYRFALNIADEKVVLIEEIASLVAAELRRQGLAEGEDSYLEPYAAQVESRIEDQVLRTANLM